MYCNSVLQNVFDSEDLTIRTYSDYRKKEKEKDQSSGSANAWPSLRYQPCWFSALYAGNAIPCDRILTDVAGKHLARQAPSRSNQITYLASADDRDLTTMNW